MATTDHILEVGWPGNETMRGTCWWYEGASCLPRPVPQYKLNKHAGVLGVHHTTVTRCCFLSFMRPAQ